MIDQRSVGEIATAHPGPWRFTTKPPAGKVGGALIQCWDAKGVEVPMSVILRVAHLVSGRFQTGPPPMPT